jgi:energy-coupling factor transporter ATP-binding protein EcfA2
MRVASISVSNFLGLSAATVSMDRALTVVTGANGSGKSTLLQALNLAVDAVRGTSAGALATLDQEWATAGRGGACSFGIGVKVIFDAPEEQALIDAFYRAATLRLCHPEVADVSALVVAIDDRLPRDVSQPMMTGELVVIHDARRRSRWTVGWQFESAGGCAHVHLLGDEMASLVDGPVTAVSSHATYVSELVPSTNDIVDKITSGRLPINLLDHVTGRRIDFAVTGLNIPAQPDWIESLWGAIGHRGGVQDRVLFDTVLRKLLGARLQVTDNQRAPVRTQFDIEELATAPDLRDGSLLALELHRLKNGASDDRRRFAHTQELFGQLTGERFDCTEQVITDDGGVNVVIEPVIQTNADAGTALDVPLRRAGAGAVEALLLATLLADERRCLFLDEPGTHLSPTAQRRLLSMLRARRGQPGQAVWVTHNPDLVPVVAEEDLRSIVRISQNSSGARVKALNLATTSDIAVARKLLASAEIRAVLFAEGLVIFEGPTDLAAIGRWLDNGIVDHTGSLPSPDERNVVFVSADGDSGFGSLAGLANQFGVPWAIVADGPAMRPGSKLARQLAKLGRTVPQHSANLADVREHWTKEGVYTLADEFGDDGSKGGEVEVFLARVDSTALAQVRHDVGAVKGARVGAAYADAVPVPSEVVALWASLLASLGLHR